MMRATAIFLASLIVLDMAQLHAQTANKSRTIDIEGLVIEGEIQRPEAFFILNRDEPEVFSTLTLDPSDSPQKQIEEWARSEIFR